MILSYLTAVMRWSSRRSYGIRPFRSLLWVFSGQSLADGSAM